MSKSNLTKEQRKQAAKARKNRKSGRGKQWQQLAA